MKLSYSAKKFLSHYFIAECVAGAVIFQALIGYYCLYGDSVWREFYQFKLISSYSLTLIFAPIYAAWRLPYHHNYWKKNHLNKNDE